MALGLGVVKGPARGVPRDTVELVDPDGRVDPRESRVDDPTGSLSRNCF